MHAEARLRAGLASGQIREMFSIAILIHGQVMRRVDRIAGVAP